MVYLSNNRKLRRSIGTLSFFFSFCVREETHRLHFISGINGREKERKRKGERYHRGKNRWSLKRPRGGNNTGSRRVSLAHSWLPVVAAIANIYPSHVKKK